VSFSSPKGRPSASFSARLKSAIKAPQILIEPLGKEISDGAKEMDYASQSGSFMIAIKTYKN